MRLTCTSGGPARSCGSPSGSWDSGRRPPQTGAASLSSRSWAHWRAPLLSSRRSAGLHRRHRNADDACCQRAVQHRGKAVPPPVADGHGEAAGGGRRQRRWRLMTWWSTASLEAVTCAPARRSAAVLTATPGSFAPASKPTALSCSIGSVRKWRSSTSASLRPWPRAPPDGTGLSSTLGRFSHTHAGSKPPAYIATAGTAHS